MKTRFAMMAALLAAALLFAAMAGHDWASPRRLLQALSGAPDMESRLLLVWRLACAIASSPMPSRSHALPG